MYFIYLQKLLRRGRMIIQCLQLTEALENPQIFHASARCKHRIIPSFSTFSQVPVADPAGWACVVTKQRWFNGVE